MKNGVMEYTRQITLQVTNGLLGSNGAAFLPRIYVPDGCTQVQLSKSGDITAQAGGTNVSLGRIVLGIFPQGEKMRVSGCFFTSEDAAIARYPNQNDSGSIATGPIGEEAKSQSHPAIPREHLPQPIRINRAILEVAKSKPAPRVEEGNSQISQTIKIFVRPESTVPGSTFTLGDIADIKAPVSDLQKLKAIWIGNSPLLGFSRNLDTNLIRLRLLGNGYKEGSFQLSLPDSITIRRNSKTVTMEELQKAALSAVENSAGTQTQFNVTSPVSPVVVAPGTVSVQAEDVQPSGHGYFVTLSITDNGSPVATRSLTLMPSIGAITVKPGDIVSVELSAGAASVTIQGTVMNRAYLGQAVQVKVKGVGVGTTIQQGILKSGSMVEVKL